jgi:ribosomal protein S19
VDHWGWFAALGALYIPTVFGLQAYMRTAEKPLPIKPFLVVWNLTLSVFSGVGFYNVGVADQAVASGLADFQTMVCETERYHMPSGFWIFLFVLSKGPEFVDTVWLILRKRPVIFLHWYHHIVTYLYVWRAMAVTRAHDAAGVVFATANLGVHTIMYL